MEFEFEVENFSLKHTLISGQCFRFEILSEGRFLVFAGSNFAIVQQVGSLLKFEKSTCDVSFWFDYFDLSFDYSNVVKGFVGDLTLESALKFCGGLHILNQNPFEVLISFLLSSNNNIPRIKKIISILCSEFGEKFNWGFAFPKLKSLSDCSLNDFLVLKAGFRTKYVYDAVRKVVSGDVDLNGIFRMKVDEARKQLLKINGVGNKIADCVLLFAYHKLEVFPVDVWMNRVIENYYRTGLSEQILSCPGFAQQLLYHSKRSGVI